MCVAVGDLSAVRAGELDVPLRRGQLLAAGAGVLQRPQFTRVAERRKQRKGESRRIFKEEDALWEV